MNIIVSSKNGFNVRLCVMSINLSESVNSGWLHFTLNFLQLKQHLDSSTCCFKFSNSFETFSFFVQPRSHCKALNASAERSFDTRKVGVSGIFQ